MKKSRWWFSYIILTYHYHYYHDYIIIIIIWLIINPHMINHFMWYHIIPIMISLMSSSTSSPYHQPFTAQYHMNPLISTDLHRWQRVKPVKSQELTGGSDAPNGRPNGVACKWPVSDWNAERHAFQIYGKMEDGWRMIGSFFDDFGCLDDFGWFWISWRTFDHFCRIFGIEIEIKH